MTSGRSFRVFLAERPHRRGIEQRIVVVHGATAKTVLLTLGKGDNDGTILISAAPVFVTTSGDLGRGVRMPIQALHRR